MPTKFDRWVHDNSKHRQTHTSRGADFFRGFSAFRTRMAARAAFFVSPPRMIFLCNIFAIGGAQNRVRRSSTEIQRLFGIYGFLVTQAPGADGPKAVIVGAPCARLVRMEGGAKQILTPFHGIGVGKIQEKRGQNCENDDNPPPPPIGKTSKTKTKHEKQNKIFPKKSKSTTSNLYSFCFCFWIYSGFRKNIFGVVFGKKKKNKKK